MEPLNKKDMGHFSWVSHPKSPIKTLPDKKHNCDSTNTQKHSTTCVILVFSCLILTKMSILTINVLRQFKPLVFVTFLMVTRVSAFSNEFDKKELLLEKVNIDNIAAVFNKVAYGSTTKRSIPENAYPVTTLSTPLLTTFRYSDGTEEWMRVDVKKNGPPQHPPIIQNVGGIDFDPDYSENKREDSYGVDLEKDHALPTSAPAADVLKNNNNRNYNNPNRYNNDRFKNSANNGAQTETATDNVFKTTTFNSLLRNVRPTKSMYSKEIPSYVPPNRAFFTPPLPPEYLHPFLDKPTLRGTNSENFVNRRPIPPPSLMPSKDRIPFRPDLPRVNIEKGLDRTEVPKTTVNSANNPAQPNAAVEKKKTLNTPSHNVRIGEQFNKNVNESNFEYDKAYKPSLSRILSGPNGRHDDFPDLLFASVTGTPPLQPKQKIRTPANDQQEKPKSIPQDNDPLDEKLEPLVTPKKDTISPELDSAKDTKPIDRSESVTIKKEDRIIAKKTEDLTTQMSDVLNLPNVKEKELNVTKASSDEIWYIMWNVHVYLVVFGYILLALYSIYKLIRYENDPHMFSKSYFLTIHLMLTIICILRIFYLTYDAYNYHKSFNILLYDFLHNFPLSLLATTFAVLILFLLKRTLTHLEVKTKPVFLVVFAFLHILLCFILSLFETFGQIEKASLIVCKPVFVLLAWALGFSYLYLYRIIKNVLAKKSQNISEMCTQNISYASHITIAVALLFVLLGFVQLYPLFFIKVDRFNGEIKHHWILWSFELSVRFIEISIITLLAIVVSLKMSQREKQSAGGFPLFPCTTSDSSTDNIYPNNCNTNPNAVNYSRNELILDNIPGDPIERPNLLKTAFQNDSFDKKSTLERYHSDNERQNHFDRFERPKWGSDRFDSRNNIDQNAGVVNFDRTNSAHNSARSERVRNKTYDTAKYYSKPKYDLEFPNEAPEHFQAAQQDRNIYSEPLDNHGHQYERTRHDFERSDFERRSRNSSNTSGRRSTGRARKNHARPHLGVQTLPNHDRVNHAPVAGPQIPDTMLVDEQGFVRFRHMQEEHNRSNRSKKNVDSLNHFSDA